MKKYYTFVTMYSKLLDIVAKSPTETSVGSAKPPQKYFSDINYSNHY